MQYLKNYGFVIFMLIGIVSGTAVGLCWPEAKGLKPLGDLFINMMFCIVVPMVFVSIASAIANMGSAGRAGKVMGITITTFTVTALIASLLMYGVVSCIDIVPVGFSVSEMAASAAEVKSVSISELVVNFFTKPDFVELLSRRAMLPLIVAAVIFGFGVQLAGGRQTMTAKLLDDLSRCIMKTVTIVSYYAPIGFFGFFADLAATYGGDLMGGYAKTLLVYWGMCFVYLAVFFPLYAWFGGGRHAVPLMWRHIFRPAAVSFGTCSSVATIPTNIEAAKSSGVSKEVADIVLPLGATMHMDGSAMGAIIKVAFLFGISGMDFNSGEAILAIAIAVFSSVAMSGIPGGGGVGELVLCSFFFNNSPEQLTTAYTLALAIGNLIDPPATMVNAAGDYVSTYIVSKYVDGKEWLQERLASAEQA
ncbi:dicarboxylate/amino acid:cation symporter [Selenomonas caprae]|uniref:Na+/H+-dicarboxylate symporter n=2 Tax=Selenomonas TaxID=970 RepID=A0A1I3DJ15_SELRU|nr:MULTISPECIES: dicarboxylate/amino acid:cation symporter [Selenomonas]TYZ26592.1 dicarboxylate/amino acid:cation symporter [Selenomonas caprae]SFH86676.1 Na+/H+-dicarboxylate symporter [Selenomonas ruminantium]